MAALSYLKFKKKCFPCIDEETQEHLLNYFEILIIEFLVDELGKNQNPDDQEDMDTLAPLEEFYVWSVRRRSQFTSNN